MASGLAAYRSYESWMATYLEVQQEQRQKAAASQRSRSSSDPRPSLERAQTTLGLGTHRPPLASPSLSPRAGDNLNGAQAVASRSNSQTAGATHHNHLDPASYASASKSATTAASPDRPVTSPEQTPRPQHHRPTPPHLPHHHHHHHHHQHPNPPPAPARSPPSPAPTSHHHWPIAFRRHQQQRPATACAHTAPTATGFVALDGTAALTTRPSDTAREELSSGSLAGAQLPSSPSRLQKHARKLSLRGLPLHHHIIAPSGTTPTSPPDSLFPTSPTSPTNYTVEGRQQHDQLGRRPSAAPIYPPRTDSIAGSGRSANMSSHSETTFPVARAASTEGSAGPPSTTSSNPFSSKPSVIRNGRGFLPDPTLTYPLPVDLTELHRQSLRTLLLFQLFGGPVTSPAFAEKPPMRVLDLGCGSGFWSMMCHRYFAQYGHNNISFTGIDIAPLATFDSTFKPDKDMRWRFVQHDIRRRPWPFPDGEFDLVISKDMALTMDATSVQYHTEELLRVLAPGGILECWESDNTIRMLRPHVPRTLPGPSAGADHAAEDSSSESDEEDEATKLGAYIMTSNTPLSAPLNSFLVEYNGWISKALTARGLNPVPTTTIGPTLLQESEILTDIRSKRLAVPLSEIRWEREGVGGVVTKDGKSYIDSMKGKGRIPDMKGRTGGKMLNAAQAALRRTALETVVGQMQSFETLLRDMTGKSQDEWDGWLGKMMNDLLREGGTSWGECLEVGAWSARKRGTPPTS